MLSCFAGITHPGLIGCAPSHELLAKWNKREAELVATNLDRIPPLAALPNPNNAILGSLKGTDFDCVATEAARTVPPREHGGNCDIKNLSKSSRIYFPVYVEGGKLSMGDIHFSQGDGEISFCGAIEMSGYIDNLNSGNLRLASGETQEPRVVKSDRDKEPATPKYRQQQNGRPWMIS